MAARLGNSGNHDRRRLTPLQRFISFCRFQPETGCVLWIGGTTCGRGKHIPYPAFWFEGRRWPGHRWAGKFIHGLDIEHYHVDHCCPNIPIPNTLCVEHLQTKTLLENVALQHQRRKHFVYLQVGLLDYDEVYGGLPPPVDDVPFYTPPLWLQPKELTHDDCPF